MKNRLLKCGWVSLVLCSFEAILVSFAFDSGKAAEPPSESKTEELAKETQNPVANLISVPFQNNLISVLAQTT